MHSESVAEIVVKQLITPEHQAVPVLQALLQKFSFVILTLADTARLHESLADTLSELECSEKLILVAANENQIGFKPCCFPFYSDISGALNRVKGKRSIAEAVKQVISLPIMKSTVFKLLHLLKDPDIPFKKIEEALIKEDTLVDRILKIANGANFGRRTPFENLNGVVSFLGIEGIRQILIEEAFVILAKVFINQPDKLTHMRRCSVLATYIGKLLGAEQGMHWKMRSAGLMHDLGSLVLYYFNSADYARSRLKMKAGKTPVCEAEKEAFGMNHQEVGEYLAAQIGIPDYLLPAIGHHHDPEMPSDDLILLSVALANGYLNSQIEQVGFTPYEQYLPILAEVRRENMAGKEQTRKKVTIELEDSGDEAPPEDAADDDVFNSADIHFLLREEVGKVLLSGYRTENF